MGTRGRFWKVGPTIALAVSVSVVVVVVVIISQNVHTDRPTSRDGVIEEVLVDVDSITATLPAGTVTASSDTSNASACPGGGGEEIAVSRTMTVGPDFDRYAWIESVTRRYKDGAGASRCAPWAARATSHSNSSASSSSSTGSPSRMRPVKCR